MKSELDLEARIHAIGSRVASCRKYCDGIALNPKEGILPRGLFLELVGRSEGKGSAIVGINPGVGRARETSWYVNKGITYEQTLAHWRANNHNIRYHTELRRLLNQLSLGGPILWTELAKCQNAPGEKPSLQTFRTCTNSFLTEELECIPTDWPLLGVGWEAYKALAYLYPNRVVVGVPHPTGSRGQFRRLFDHNMSLLGHVKDSVSDVLSNETAKVAWLSANSGRRL